MAVNRTRRARRFLGILAAGSLLGACGSSSTPSKDAITVYSGQHPQTTAALVAAFEKKTGIAVSVRNADEAVLANQIKVEASRSPADVFVAGNSPALESVASAGLLTQLPGSILSRVPAQYSSPSHSWVGVTARVAVLAYSRSSLGPDELPASILDLALPQWRGKIGLAPSESDFQPIVASVERAVGEKRCVAWLKAIKENAGSHLYPSNEVLLSALERGEVELGVLEQYYWYRRAAQEGSSAMNTSVATFNDGDAGYVLAISGAGVLAASDNKSAAQRFVAFLVSREGQAIIASSGGFEYPLADGVTTPAGEPPFDSLHPAPTSVADLGDGAGSLRLLQEAQLL
ncbi:MAG: extracellular solute-binding protein [Actinomycetes bacterium]